MIRAAAHTIDTAACRVFFAANAVPQDIPVRTRSAMVSDIVPFLAVCHHTSKRQRACDAILVGQSMAVIALYATTVGRIRFTVLTSFDVSLWAVCTNILNDFVTVNASVDDAGSI